MGLLAETAVAPETVGVTRPVILGADDSEGARDAAALASVLAPLLGAGVVPVRAGASPAQQLSEEASARRAELVVVGSSHRGEPGRTAAGKMLRRLVHDGPAPIAVAPRGYADEEVGRPRVIAVAFDDSPESHRALGLAARLAGAASAALRVITVYEGGSAPDEPAAEPGVVTQRGAMQEALLRTVAELPSALRAEPRFLTGGVAPTLAQQSELGVDLMVMGSRGYGPVRSFWLGSVSEHLVGISPRPLVITPRGLLDAGTA
jgi:nucleotide-binding universal stress UspA family protein